jgi:hypothetical protein
MPIGSSDYSPEFECHVFPCVRHLGGDYLAGGNAQLGLCREDQAWLILFLNAQRAQDIFQSWADFSHAYAQARYAWIEQKNQEAASQRSFVEVQEYLNERLGNWSTLAWADYKIFDPQPVKP